MNLTKVLAWVGGVTGPTAILWDVYKYRRRGALIAVEVALDMIFFPPFPGDSKETSYVSVTATNNGDRPATITNLAGFWYRTWTQRARRKPEKSFIIPRPQPGHPPIPHLLNPGERWMGCFQQAEMKEYASKGALFLGVFHTATKRGTFERARVKSNKTS